MEVKKIELQFLSINIFKTLSSSGCNDNSEGGLTYKAVEHDLERRSVTQHALQAHARPAHARGHLLRNHAHLKH